MDIYISFILFFSLACIYDMIFFLKVLSLFPFLLIFSHFISFGIPFYIILFKNDILFTFDQNFNKNKSLFTLKFYYFFFLFRFEINHNMNNWEMRFINLFNFVDFFNNWLTYFKCLNFFWWFSCLCGNWLSRSCYKEFFEYK